MCFIFGLHIKSPDALARETHHSPNSSGYTVDPLSVISNDRLLISTEQKLWRTVEGTVVNKYGRVSIKICTVLSLVDIK